MMHLCQNCRVLQTWCFIPENYLVGFEPSASVSLSAHGPLDSTARICSGPQIQRLFPENLKDHSMLMRLCAMADAAFFAILP